VEETEREKKMKNTGKGEETNSKKNQNF